MPFDISILITIAWVVLIIAVAGIISVTWSDLKGAPFVTTPRWMIRKMLDLAQVGPDDVVYDLGSGDGRILFIAAQEFGAKAVGIEIDPLRYLWTRGLISWKSLEDQVEVWREDMFAADVSAASVVTCYLQSETNLKLMNNLESELSPGARVVSRSFEFPGWHLIKEERVGKKEKLYCYRISEYKSI